MEDLVITKYKEVKLAETYIDINIGWFVRFFRL